MIVCAGSKEQFSFATAVGIGMIDVAISLSKVCIEKKPNYFTFVGTAGSYGDKKIFDIVESTRACNIENSFFNAKAYSPIDSYIPLNDNVSRETINSSNYISTDKEIAKKYLERNINLENMEFYAVLKVAEKFNIGAKGIFIVTNYCNENAHKDFIANHEEAMERLTQYMQENNYIQKSTYD